jgi:prepilin-type processing-associated H-X9-DG protein
MSNPNSPVPLDYQAPQTVKRRRWIIAVIAVAVLALGFATSFLIPPSINQGGSYDRPKCASNMHQIGLAILLYSQDHGQNYPNTLAELMEEQLTTNVFICPQSLDAASTGATTQAVAADFQKPGHLSYIYLGKGLRADTVSDDTVVLYEPLSNHAGAGMNVLFGDGHTEFISPAVGTKFLAAVATGIRPVKINSSGAVIATQPSTSN